MVLKRKSVMVLLTIAVLMAIFPPWIVREGRHRSFGPAHAGEYSFIADPPSNNAVATIDVGRLAVQYIALGAVALIISLKRSGAVGKSQNLSSTHAELHELSWRQRNIPTLFPSPKSTVMNIDKESNSQKVRRQTKEGGWYASIGFWCLILVGGMAPVLFSYTSVSTIDDFVEQGIAGLVSAFMLGSVFTFGVGLFSSNRKAQLVGCLMGVVLAFIATSQFNPQLSQAAESETDSRTENAPVFD